LLFRFGFCWHVFNVLWPRPARQRAGSHSLFYIVNGSPKQLGLGPAMISWSFSPRMLPSSSK
jgi:hypothetical protein